MHSPSVAVFNVIPACQQVGPITTVSTWYGRSVDVIRLVSGSFHFDLSSVYAHDSSRCSLCLLSITTLFWDLVGTDYVDGEKGRLYLYRKELRQLFFPIEERAITPLSLGHIMRYLEQSAWLSPLISSERLGGSDADAMVAWYGSYCESGDEACAR